MKDSSVKISICFWLSLSLSVIYSPFIFASQVIASDNNTKIHVRKGRTTNYYHLEYVLTADNLITPEHKSDLMLVSEGGHFEVRIKKDKFPIQAPNCKENIILDMPWTKSTLISALRKIEKKSALFRSIQEVADGVKKELKVVIELNPNIKVKNKDPIDIELTQCHVFFRSARDSYIDYIGNLR